MDFSKPFDNKARMSYPPMDEWTWLGEEQPRNGAAETTTDGVRIVAENETRDKLVKIYSYFGNRYSVDHSGVVKCPICCLKYDNIPVLRIHLQQHSIKCPYICGRCRLTFGARINLERHLLIHCQNECFQCLECGCTFTQESSIHSHMAIVHKGHPHHQSSQCNNTSKSHSQIREYSKIYHKETFNDGNQNGNQENHQRALQTLNSSNKEITRSDTCSTGNQGSQDNFENDSQLVFRLNTPGGSYSSSHPNNCHTAYHELLTPFMNNARGHNNVETGKSLAPEEAIAWVPKLNEARMNCSPLDERTQMQGPADIATVGDGGVAENANGWIQLRWYGNSPYSVNYRNLHKCPLCDERCSLSSFKKHLQQHRFEEPYNCGFCEYPSKTIAALQKHLIVHSGNKSFQCLKCDRIYSLETSVRLHLSYIHERVEKNGNQNAKKKNHQKFINTSTSNSNETTSPDIYILTDVGNQGNSDNYSQPDLRWIVADRSCSSSHPSDSHREYPEEELICLSSEEVAFHLQELEDKMPVRFWASRKIP